MSKKEVLLVVAVLVVVIAEVFVVMNLRTLRGARSAPTPTPVQSAPGTLRLDQLPQGYYGYSNLEVTNGIPKSFIMVAQLTDAVLQKDDTVLATISFATNQGSGNTVDQKILIYPPLTAIAQNTQELLPTKVHIKISTITGGKQMMTLLQTLKGKRVGITFIDANPNNNKKPVSSVIDPICNNALYLSLSGSGQQPSCLPSTGSIHYYENF